MMQEADLPSDSRTRFWRRFFVFFILTGALLRFADCLLENPVDFALSDPLRHWNNALAVWHPKMMNGFDPLIYQLYLWLVQRVSDCKPWALGTLCGVLSLYMPWSFYKAARSWGMTQTNALAFYAILTWMPSFFTIYHYFMMETLLMVLMGLSLWASGECFKTPDRRHYFWMVFAWGITCLTKPTLIPAAAVTWLFVSFKTGVRWRYFIMSGLLTIALLIPNTVRSYYVLGYVAPFGSTWINTIALRTDTKYVVTDWEGEVWTFASPSSFTKPFAPFSDWTFRRYHNEDKSFVKASRATGTDGWKAGYVSVTNTPSDWPRRYGENAIMLLFGPSWPDAAPYSWIGSEKGELINTINFWQRWLWVPLMIYTTIGNLGRLRKGHIDLLPMIIVATMLLLLLQCQTIMEGRYRKPIEPLLIWNVFVLRKNKGQKEKDYPYG